MKKIVIENDYVKTTIKDVMKIRKIKNRGILFTHSNPEWDLNVYLISGRKFNYIIDTGLQF